MQSRSQQGLNALSNYEWVFIQNKTEAEVAQILQESLLFIFLSKEEGLPLMPLEAMSCGCLVVGYDVPPLTEYIPSPLLFEPGNIVDIARMIETITQAFPQEIEQWETVNKAGLKVALDYSLQREEESVIAAWETILQKHGASSALLSHPAKAVL